ncbi:EamA family transporter [Streptomyces sp. NPDC052101]|uniref:EamA family transporter n=1 Tax=Streptomyces sp. NPDC052101 TaxID=3155763 RepID=UPI003444C2D0
MHRYKAQAATVLLTALAPASWGTTYAITTRLLPPGHPLFAGLMRALPAGLLALAITRVLPRGPWWWKTAVLGLLNIGPMPLLFVAAERLPGGVAATLGAAQPLLAAGLGLAVLHDRPTARRLAWGVLGVIGVGLVVLGPGARLDAVGVLAGLGHTATMAAGVVLTKRWGRPPGVGPLALTGWQLTVGGLLLLPLTLVTEGVPQRIDAGAAGGYLWLGSMGGLIAYTLWFRGIGRLPVAASAPLVLLSPLVATVIGIAQGESLSPLQTLGFALALTALVAAQLGPAGRKTTGTEKEKRPDDERDEGNEGDAGDGGGEGVDGRDGAAHDHRRARGHRDGRWPGGHRGERARTPRAGVVPEAGE